MIELIVIIVLLGIVGVVVIPRFMAPNAFNEPAARDGLLATIRAAQQSSLGRASVKFEIASDVNNWTFTASTGATTLRTFQVPIRDVLLETGTAASSSDTCATGFDAAIASDFKLEFTNGNLQKFTNNGSTTNVNPSFNGVRICLNDTVAVSVCVSPAGYAYVGNCDE